MCVQRVEQRSQHATLWGPCAECQSGGKVRAHSDRLWPVCQEVLNPKAEVEPYTQVGHLGEQSAGDDGIKGRALVHKQ